MSEQKPITKVADGHARFYTTRQKAPNEMKLDDQDRHCFTLSQYDRC